MSAGVKGEREREKEGERERERESLLKKESRSVKKVMYM